MVAGSAIEALLTFHSSTATNNPISFFRECCGLKGQSFSFYMYFSYSVSVLLTSVDFSFHNSCFWLPDQPCAFLGTLLSSKCEQLYSCNITFYSNSIHHNIHHCRKTEMVVCLMVYFSNLFYKKNQCSVNIKDIK